MLCLLERLPGFEDLKSQIEIARWKRFTPTARLGGLAPKYKDCGPAVSYRQGAEGAEGQKGARRISCPARPHAVRRKLRRVRRESGL